MNRLRYWINKRKLASHFGVDDCVIDGFRFNPVHEEPTIEEWKFGFENDFYLDTKRSFYLVTIKFASREVVSFQKGTGSRNKRIDYFVIELADLEDFKKGRNYLLLLATKLMKEYLNIEGVTNGGDVMKKV